MKNLSYTFSTPNSLKQITYELNCDELIAGDAMILALIGNQMFWKNGGCAGIKLEM
jgi:hypothetical protein